MLTLLKVFGIIGLAVFLLLIAGLVFLVRWLRKVIQSGVEESHSPPCRIYPEPEPNPQWRSPDKINRYAAEFRALGFQDVGAFTIPQVDGLQMLAFVHVQERLYGVIYDHKKVPPTYDICCDFEDKSGLTATNSKAGSALDQRPGHPSLWLGDDRVAAVLEAVRKHPQPAPRVPVSAGQFLSAFTRSYAEGMNWRMKKGGVSRDEIRRHAEHRGMKLDDEALDAVYRSQRKAHVTELQRGCLAQYLDEQQIPAGEWERIRQRALVVPETLQADEVFEALEAAMPLDQEQRHTLKKLRKADCDTALDFIDSILKDNVAGLNLKKTGEVQEPVHAYIFLAPPQPAPVTTVSDCVPA